MPVVLVSCVNATTLVRGVMALSNAAMRSTLLRAGYRDGLDLQPLAAGAHFPGRRCSTVIVVRDHDLVAPLLVDPLDDDGAAFARIPGDRDLIGGGADHGGEFGPQLLVRRLVFLAILERRIGEWKSRMDVSVSCGRRSW